MSRGPSGLEAEDLAAERGDQATRQVAVGDGAAERALRRALLVDVDPLVVVGGVGEQVDAVLVDLEPVAGAEVLAHGGGELVDVGEGAHGVPRRAGY